VLLHPFPFTIENPPELGKVWAAQERLWTQRTILEVIAKVNKDAEDWSTATIKQINLLEVGNGLAQDQKSIAKGETLNEAPAITNPAAPPPPTPEGGTDPNNPGAAAMPTANVDSVFYIKNDSTQFKVMPVMMTVLVDQNHIQDFLVALENSPMTIQARDFELAKPSARVTKPEKGQSMGGFAMGGMMGERGGMGMMMGRMMGGQMRGMTGFGGGMANMMRGRMNREMMGAGNPMMGMMGRMGGMGGMGGMMPGADHKGVDKRSENRAKKFQEEKEAVEKTTQSSLHDPYYTIVEVKVYGQAKFFNPPPTETPEEPSQSENADGETPKADADAKAKADEPKAEAEGKAEEAPKADEEPKAEGKTDDSEKSAAEPKAEGKAEPKADEAPAEAPKAEEAPKADEPKAEAPETKAADAEKPAAPK